MAFQDFDDLSRKWLKRTHRAVLGCVIVRSELPKGKTKTTSTTFRFSTDLVDKAGWISTTERLRILIDPEDRVIRIQPTNQGGYKLITPSTGSPYVKFTVTPGMPSAKEVVQVSDVVVAAGEMLFSLPNTIELKTPTPCETTK